MLAYIHLFQTKPWLEKSEQSAERDQQFPSFTIEKM